MEMNGVNDAMHRKGKVVNNAIKWLVAKIRPKTNSMSLYKPIHGATMVNEDTEALVTKTDMTYDW